MSVFSIDILIFILLVMKASNGFSNIMNSKMSADKEANKMILVTIKLMFFVLSFTGSRASKCVCVFRKISIVVYYI